MTFRNHVKLMLASMHISCVFICPCLMYHACALFYFDMRVKEKNNAHTRSFVSSKSQIRKAMRGRKNLQLKEEKNATNEVLWKGHTQKNTFNEIKIIIITTFEYREYAHWLSDCIHFTSISVQKKLFRRVRQDKEKIPSFSMIQENRSKKKYRKHWNKQHWKQIKKTKFRQKFPAKALQMDGKVNRM